MHHQKRQGISLLLHQEKFKTEYLRIACLAWPLGDQDNQKATHPPQAAIASFLDENFNDKFSASKAARNKTSAPTRKNSKPDAFDNMCSNQDNYKAGYHRRWLRRIESGKKQAPALLRKTQNQTLSMACVAIKITGKQVIIYKRLYIIESCKEQAPRPARRILKPNAFAWHA